MKNIFKISSKIQINLGMLPLGKISYLNEIQDIFLNKFNFFYLKKENEILYYAKPVVNHDITVEYHEGSLIFDDCLEKKRYILIPHLRNDSILKKYGIVQQADFSVLEFRKKLLWNVWLIDRNLKLIKKVKKTDFKSPEKPRILMEPITVLFQLDLYIKGLRELGYTADYMIWECESDKWLMDNPPTFDLKLKKIDTRTKRTRLIEFFLYALENYDIFHTHSNCSLFIGEKYWDQNADLYFLKRMGKKIVSSFWSFCDVGCKTELYSEECKKCIRAKPIRCKSLTYKRCADNTLKYSDYLLSSGKVCEAFPQAKWIDNPLDIEIWKRCSDDKIPKKFKLPETDKLRVYHSFANSNIRDDLKGSQYIKRAIERLQTEGYQIEAMILDKVEHKNLKYYQMQADIIVDQLYAGWHGSTGVESMAVGKPVITNVAEGVPPCIPDEREYPFVSANKDTIYSVLKECLDNPSKMKEMGAASRVYAEKYHDYRVVVKQLENVYKKIWNNSAENIREMANDGNTQISE